MPLPSSPAGLRLADRMAGVVPNAIGELLRHGADPSVISFAGGYPDASLFPVEGIRAIMDELLDGHHNGALQYTVSDGLPELREQVARFMRTDGLDIGADDVLILQGGQQGLDLAGKLVLNPGDAIVTENPTFLGAMIAFAPNQPTYAPVRMDDDGMVIEDLERVLASTPRARLLYTVPEFQNPTGVTLSVERRQALMDLADRYDLVVIEDTPYRHLRYDGTSLPTLKSLDTQGRVIHLGSFSKILAPGMRLGWAVAAPELLGKLGLLKLAADTQCSTLNMAAAAEFMARYDIHVHIDHMRGAYKRKRDLMLDSLTEHMPPGVTWTQPVGGLFTWLTFPDGFDATAFMRDRALPIAKVAYVPGATFFPVHQEPNHARVNFSGATDAGIREGVQRLGALLRETLPG